MPPRTLRPGQACQVWIHRVDTSESKLVFETRGILLEAPNWSLDGRDLILNGDGALWRLPVDAPELEQIRITGTPDFNNDHVLDPDGKHVFLSTYDDWQIYRAPLTGGKATQITNTKSKSNLLHFLHGVSPDGRELAFVGIQLNPNAPGFVLKSAEIFTIEVDGANMTQITATGAPADGPEYSPDGEWIYFNTEMFSGTAQIARMRREGGDIERLTYAPTVDWFPHLAPSGKLAAYLAFPTGTKGHPADLPVDLKLVRDGLWHEAKTVARLFGGQGTINVNSWSPDSKSFAYVAYPMTA
ncbi:MAG: PD40 domain-containing protein [Alphaproteobacteria bacterium]|nr:PD40 domain-containing protein [Alphaproteobacteria bacterium]